MVILKSCLHLNGFKSFFKVTLKYNHYIHLGLYMESGYKELRNTIFKLLTLD